MQLYYHQNYTEICFSFEFCNQITPLCVCVCVFTNLSQNRPFLRFTCIEKNCPTFHFFEHIKSYQYEEKEQFFKGGGGNIYFFLNVICKSSNPHPSPTPHRRAVIFYGFFSFCFCFAYHVVFNFKNRKIQ